MRTTHDYSTTHGWSGGSKGKRPPEYLAWQNMLARCYNPNNPRYAAYGGRGILVCDRWRTDFAAFLADMGMRPSKRHSLERVDNDKGYFPDNCTWALPHDQATNRRNTDMIGPTPLAALARERNIPANTLRFRVRKGWSLDDALTRPVRPKAHSKGGKIGEA